MSQPQAEIRRVVPRSALHGWLAALAALPIIWLCLDPLTDSVRVALHAMPGAETLMQTVRPFGKFETQALMILPAFLIGWRLRWRPARSWLALTFACLLTAGAATYLMKLAVRRDRPTITSDNINAEGLAAITTGKCMSFPSGDTAAAFAIACVLAAYVPCLRAPAMIVACLVGLSRVYFGCHYFSDVVAGALLGTLVAAVVLTATRRRRIVVVET